MKTPLLAWTLDSILPQSCNNHVCGRLILLVTDDPTCELPERTEEWIIHK